VKHAVAVALLFAGFVIAAPARAADGLAPGSLADRPETAAPVETPENAAPVDAPESAAATADDAGSRCDNCPPPRRYDNQQVVKTRRDLHHTIKTVNTYEMAPAKRVEQGGIRVRSDVTLVNFVVHRYRVIEAPALVDASEAQEGYAPAVYRPKRACRHGRYDRYGDHCRPLLRVRG
jgi:hypothetical protein